MVSILPSGTPGSLISADVGRALQSVLPQSVQQGYNRGMLQKSLGDIRNSSQDPNASLIDMLLSLVQGTAGIPGSERYVGQIAPLLMNRKIAENAYGNKGQSSVSQSSVNPNKNLPQTESGYINPIDEFRGPKASQRPINSDYDTKTPEQIDKQAQQMASDLGNPDLYPKILGELNTKNQMAEAYRNNLEKNAQAKFNISTEDLPEFMEIGKSENSSNIDQWLINTNRKFDEYKRDKQKIEQTFIPGIGNGLIGNNRDEALKNLIPTIQKEVQRGREEQTRKYLASEYVSPTEIEGLIHPPTPKLEKAIESFPKGIFPAQKKSTWGDVKEVFKGKLPAYQTNPFISYEEAKIKDPRALEVMEDRLTDFFLKNVDENTALSPLTEKLWDKKDYDWRQFGPALRKAEEKGLTFTPSQRAEISRIETQAPIQSLPHIFQTWDRMFDVIRGNK